MSGGQHIKRAEIWLKSFRLRTLPLSFSCILLGSGLAYSEQLFDSLTFILCLSTTLCLQVLSNLANDLGDAQKGTDGSGRLGPKRMVQSGLITAKAMKQMIACFVILSLFSGLFLIYHTLQGLDLKLVFWFVVFGLLSILGALFYTLSKCAYGYMGLGDLSVFLFFGLLGVLGSYFLFSHSLSPRAYCLSVAVGLFSVGVLNCNNTRDIDNDRVSGKITIPVRIGRRASCYYQIVLLGLAWFSFAFSLTFLPAISLLHCLPFLSLPWFIIHLRTFVKNDSAQSYNRELKRLSLTTFLFSLLFFLGEILHVSSI